MKSFPVAADSKFSPKPLLLGFCPSLTKTALVQVTKDPHADNPTAKPLSSYLNPQRRVTESAVFSWLGCRGRLPAKPPPTSLPPTSQSPLRAPPRLSDP